MRKLYLILVALFLPATMFGQAPASFKYQTVIRNSSGQLIVNTPVSLQIAILKGSISGDPAYIEIFSPTTNDFGLVNLDIGTGTIVSGSFVTINWGDDTYFIKIWLNGTEMGASQLLSVPYALYANKAETISEDAISGNENAFVGWDKNSLDDFDGTWASLTGKPTLADVAASGSFTDLINKPTTLSGYGITDAMSTSHPAYKITVADINNWTSAYSWGDHSSFGYFKNGGEVGGVNRKLGNTDAYALSLITDNTERLFIGNNGKIGIGTNSPENALTIEGDESEWPGRYLLSIYNRSTGPKSLAYIRAKAGPSGNNTVFGHISETYIAKDSPEDMQDYGIVMSNGNGLILAAVKTNYDPGVIKFVTGLSTGTAFNERMRINESGNIGIGTRTPTSKLDVMGEINVNNNNIKNVADPINNKDAANKDYVDASKIQITAGNNITLTGNGTATTPYVLNAGINHIGEYYCGGIIFYVDYSGQHGLICSMIDVGQNVNWSNVPSTEIGASAGSYWNGQSNTNAIIGQDGHAESAAKLCDDYTNDDYGTGVYSDWYLPAIDELSLLYHARYEVDKALDNDGNSLTTLFYQGPYWSSTENGPNQALLYDHLRGHSSYPPLQKNQSAFVRAIRAF